MQRAVCLSAVISFALQSSLLAQETPAAAPAWQIVQLAGTVQVKAGAAENGANAQLNQNLPVTATVRTGPDGKAGLKAADLAGVTLQPDTTVQVGALEKNGDTTKAEVTALGGKALFLVNKLKTQESAFKVETPTAVCGVRGTAFAAKVAEDGATTRVAVFNGEVGVQGRGAEPGLLIVKEKMGTNIVCNQSPTPPEALAEAEAAEWERVKSEVQPARPWPASSPRLAA